MRRSFHNAQYAESNLEHSAANYMSAKAAYTPQQLNVALQPSKMDVFTLTAVEEYFEYLADFT